MKFKGNLERMFSYLPLSLQTILLADDQYLCYVLYIVICVKYNYLLLALLLAIIYTSKLYICIITCIKSKICMNRK